MIHSHYTFFFLLCATTSAQGILTLPSGTGDDPRSVCVISPTHVIVSNRVDGWQHVVDSSIPSSPTLVTSINPPFGDQWFEAEYTRHYGGRLFTAHRGGGINMIDVSNPLAPVTVASVPTNYHFRGMRYAPNGSNGVLYYNATNEGLEVYDVLALGTVLSSTWNNFAPTNDGNGMELIGNHLYQLGMPPTNPATRELKSYDVTNPVLPLQCDLQSIPLQNVGNGHAQMRKIGLAPATRIVACRWGDGLDLIDTTSPCNPTRTTLFPSVFGPLTINYWGSIPIANTTLVLVYGSFVITGNPNVRYYFWWPWTVPPSGAAIPGAPFQVQLDTHDMTFDENTNRLYAVGIDPNSGQGKVWVF
ncbi:MAG: hypothetical protein R3F56_22870 [Planctomycetota bacterium]